MSMGPPGRSSRARTLAFGVIGLAVSGSSGGRPLRTVPGLTVVSASSARVESSPTATGVLSARDLGTMVRRAWQYQRVTQALSMFNLAPTMTAPVIDAVVRQAASVDLDPLLIVAVIAYENPELATGAVSAAGARGIMQVMPRWTASFSSVCGDDLSVVETNVCFGVRILKLHIDDAHGSVERGLLAYVGCVRQPGCRRYPGLVLKRRQALARLLGMTPSSGSHAQG